MQVTVRSPRIIVRDIDISISYYTEVLGLTLSRRMRFDNPDAREAVLLDETGSTSVVLMQIDGGPTFSGQPAWGPMILLVDDADKAAAEITAKGHEVAFGPVSVANDAAKVLMAVDPDGYLIEIAWMNPERNMAGLGAGAVGADGKPAEVFVQRPPGTHAHRTMR